MTIFQTGLKSLAGAGAVRWAQERAQKLSSNSFTEKLVEAYSKAPVRRATGVSTPGTSTRPTSTARQEIVTAGRNLASTKSSAASAPPTPVASPFAATTAPKASTSPALTAVSMPKSQLSPLSASAPEVNNTSAPLGGSTAVTHELVEAPAMAAVNGPQSPNEIVAALLQQNAPPPPYATVGSASTDPNVYRSDNYIKNLNLNSFLQVANHDNAYRYDQYNFQLRMWTENGQHGPPPAPPKYETVDLKGFDNWWAQYNANIGYDAPSPTSFMTNGPKDGGYGWSA